jgi:hypothetical protein
VVVRAAPRMAMIGRGLAGDVRFCLSLEMEAPGHTTFIYHALSRLFRCASHEGLLYLLTCAFLTPR